MPPAFSNEKGHYVYSITLVTCVLLVGFYIYPESGTGARLMKYFLRMCNTLLIARTQ